MSSSRSAQALSLYLRQLSDVALQLCSSFRPQQFSNVLWGLAKCGYRAPTAWLGHYLHQVNHSLNIHLVHTSPVGLFHLCSTVVLMRLASLL
jgi:hypothetical protein